MTTIEKCIKRLCDKVESLTDRINKIEVDAGKGAISSVVVNEDGDYVHSNGDGASTVILTSPSKDPCNGIRFGADGRLFAENMGFRRVTSYQELIDTINANLNALVCSEIQVDQVAVLEGTGGIYFAHGGALNCNQLSVTLNCSIINPTNRQIFRNYAFDESYPGRWNNTQPGVKGYFGGNNERDPRWWGLVVNRPGTEADLARATKNSDALAAASLSAGRQATQGAQITLLLPVGNIFISRTLRLDGIRCVLKGQGSNASQLYAHSTLYTFDNSHYILTEEFPVDGTTPVVEIGYEHVVDGNGNVFDAGFNGGIRDVSIVCPLEGNFTRPISGVMWEAGLQEQNQIDMVTVKFYSGYGFGGPMRQHQSHNPVDAEGNYAPEGPFYMQLNAVRMSNLWMFDAQHADAVGMAVWGLNFSIDTVTVDHGTPGVGLKMNRPAIFTGSRFIGHWKNIHIEHSPAAGVRGGGIYNPDTQLSGERLSFDGIHLFSTGPFEEGVTLTTLLLETRRGGYACTAIACNVPYNLGGRCIRDKRAGNSGGSNVELVSKGYQQNENNNTFVACYFRQMNGDEAWPYQLVSSDPNLTNP